MTKQTTYLLLGGGAVVAYVLVSKQKTAAAKATANTSSLSGLIGGGINAVKSVSDTIGRLFGGSPSTGGGASSTYDSTKVNDSALSFLTTGQKLDLGMQVPVDSSAGTPFFGPDINPSTGEYDY